MNKNMDKFNFLGLIIPIIILVFWIIVTATNIVPSYIIPGPIKIIQVLVDFIFGVFNLTPYSGTMIENMVASCFRVFYGFGLAAFFGILLGFLTGRIVLIKLILDPTVNLIRTIPGIGWLPIAMVWFGIGEKTTIFLIALAAFFPIYINVAHGVSEVPLLFIRAGRMLGANRLTLFTTIILPSAFPSVIVGLRLGLGVSWSYLVLGELTGVLKGLGAVMMDSRMLGQIEMIPVAMISIAILGKLTDMLLLKICHIIYPFNEGAANE